MFVGCLKNPLKWLASEPTGWKAGCSPSHRGLPGTSVSPDEESSEDEDTLELMQELERIKASGLLGGVPLLWFGFSDPPPSFCGRMYYGPQGGNRLTAHPIGKPHISGDGGKWWAFPAY